VYEESNRTGVRDPRTGARASHLAHVLNDGDIDRFLIAWLNRQNHDATSSDASVSR
jgi:hypothetical protein